jgi:hypothetical protein
MVMNAGIRSFLGGAIRTAWGSGSTARGAMVGAGVGGAYGLFSNDASMLGGAIKGGLMGAGMGYGYGWLRGRAGAGLAGAATGRVMATRNSTIVNRRMMSMTWAGMAGRYGGVSGAGITRMRSVINRPAGSSLSRIKRFM